MSLQTPFSGQPGPRPVTWLHTACARLSRQDADWAKVFSADLVGDLTASLLVQSCCRAAANPSSCTPGATIRVAYLKSHGLAAPAKLLTAKLGEQNAGSCWVSLRQSSLVSALNTQEADCCCTTSPDGKQDRHERCLYDTNGMDYLNWI